MASNGSITIRQFILLFLFQSLTPIFIHIPNVSAAIGGSSGYLASIYSAIVLILYSFLLLRILKQYPGKNFYSILVDNCGVVVSRIILILYGLWAILMVMTKISYYVVLLQSTLMPALKSVILLVILCLLCVYAIAKGNKTIFRFAEFVYGPIIAMLLFIALFAFPAIQGENLIPVTSKDLVRNASGVANICAIGGNIVLILFFLNHTHGKGEFKMMKKRILRGVIVFSILAFLATLFAIGINGEYVTARSPFPIFQTVKSVSILNTFERFDAFITLFCVMSDFISICLFTMVAMKCFGWVSSQKDERPFGMAIIVLSCVVVEIRNITQYRLEIFYEQRMIYINLIFQFLLPIVLSILCMITGMRKHDLQGDTKEIPTKRY